MRNGLSHPGYSLDSNRIGVVGELAVIAHLRHVLPHGCQINWVGDSAHDPADVLVRLPSGAWVGLEVKTTTPVRWRRHGRIVAADQMYETTAVAYVWCAAERAIRLPQVHLLGWSPTREMRSSWSAAAWTGQRRDWSLLSPQPEGTPRPDEELYRYDLDETDLDDHDMPARQHYGPRDNSDLMADAAGVHAEDGLPPRLPAKGHEDWQEGCKALDGLGSIHELLRVTASLRGVSELPAWLLSYDPGAQEAH